MTSKPSCLTYPGARSLALPLLISTCLTLPSNSFAAYFPELLYENFDVHYNYEYAFDDPAAPSDFTQNTSVGVIGDQSEVIRPGFKGNIQVDTIQPTMDTTGSEVQLWNKVSWSYDYDVDNGFGYHSGTFNEASNSIAVNPVQASLKGIAIYGANQIYWLPDDSELNPIGSMPIRGGAASNITEIIPEEAIIGTEYSFHSAESIEYTTSSEFFEAMDVGLDPGTYIETSGDHEYLAKVIYLGVDRMDNYRINEPLAPSPHAWAVVRAVELTTISNESSTTYLPNGTTLPYHFGKNVTSTTTLEWRVNGIGLVKGIQLEGRYASEIFEKNYFQPNVDNNNVMVNNRFEDSIYAQLELSRFERTGGSREISLVDIPDPVVDSEGRIKLLEPFTDEIDAGNGNNNGGGNTGTDTDTNAYDPGSNQLHLQVNAGSIGMLSLSMHIDDLGRGVIHVLPETISVLPSVPSDIATYNESTGQLRIPALKANGQTLFTNLVFNLTNASTLQFTLQSFQQP